MKAVVPTKQQNTVTSVTESSVPHRFRSNIKRCTDLQFHIIWGKRNNPAGKLEHTCKRKGKSTPSVKIHT